MRATRQLMLDAWRLRCRQAQHSGRHRPLLAAAWLAAGLWAWAVWWPQTLAQRRLQAEQASQAQLATVVTAPHQPAASTSPPLDAAAAQQLLMRALARASAHGLQPGRAELRWPDPLEAGAAQSGGAEAPGIQALQLALPLQGRYAALRSWLAESSQWPGLRIDSLLLSLASASDPARASLQAESMQMHAILSVRIQRTAPSLTSEASAPVETMAMEPPSTRAAPLAIQAAGTGPLNLFRQLGQTTGNTVAEPGDEPPRWVGLGHFNGQWLPLLEFKGLSVAARPDARIGPWRVLHGDRQRVLLQQAGNGIRAELKAPAASALPQVQGLSPGSEQVLSE